VIDGDRDGDESVDPACVGQIIIIIIIVVVVVV